ncbi:MAG: formylglycine-generating enzyme family protein [Pirellulales bacterium]
MRLIDAVTWSCAAAPVAMVYGAKWRSVPRWFGGIFNSTCAAAFVRRKTPPPLVPEPRDEKRDEPLADCAEIVASEAFEAGGDANSLVEEMLARGRFALLLRPQLIANLSPEQLARARTALSEGMCLVPAGEVIVHRTTGTSEQDSDTPGRAESPVWVDGYYVDRYQVTNAEYFQFVRHGGYEQMGIWDPEVLPAVLDFVDATGHPGPRNWRDGRYPRGEDHHPVVGVCWYEAAAYARWVGKRLPTDAEWTKSASWPVAIAGQPLLQRRYPWGEAVDRTRANLWGSGPGRTVPVEEFASGVSVGGVQQLIGNVWEWTADSLRLQPDDELPDTPTRKMKSLRGGAYDTYLDCQATCHFQSGDDVLARKHNIGFRCAISLCDFAQFNSDDEIPTQESDSFVEAEV